MPTRETKTVKIVFDAIHAAATKKFLFDADYYKRDIFKQKNIFRICLARTLRKWLQTETMLQGALWVGSDVSKGVRVCLKQDVNI